jgi:hypothetical protein
MHLKHVAFFSLLTAVTTIGQQSPNRPLSDEIVRRLPAAHQQPAKSLLALRAGLPTGIAEAH